MLTRLSSVSRGWARPPDCLFSYIDPTGEARSLLVSAETRRAIEAVLDDIARWYEGRGFAAPLIRRAGDPPLEVTDAQWRRGQVDIDLLPHDPGRGPQAFEILLDPMPDTSGTHDSSYGFYDYTLRVIVVQVEPVAPAAPSDPPSPGAPPPAAPAPLPAGLAVVDPDTLAHEVLHAVSRALHGGAQSTFRRGRPRRDVRQPLRR